MSARLARCREEPRTATRTVNPHGMFEPGMPTQSNSAKSAKVRDLVVPPVGHRHGRPAPRMGHLGLTGPAVRVG